MSDFPYQSFLRELHSDPTFASFRDKELVPNTPEIPSYKPGDSSPQEEDWKYKSGLRDGYVLALTKLGVIHERTT